MKKIFITLLSALCVFGLASCDNGGGGGKGPQVKKTTITYMGWDLGTESEPTLKRKMIEEFNATSETIIIDAQPTQDPIEDFYNTLAAGNALPDVFIIDSVPTAVMKEWALDLTPYITKDPEWADVDKSLASAVTYYGSTYALPAAQHYIGFLANYELLDDYAGLADDAANVFAPGNFTKEQFYNAIKASKDVNEDGTSVVGINAVGDMINWLPSVIADNDQHFVWDETKQQFDFTGTNMTTALDEIQTLGKIASGYTFNAYADYTGTAEEDPRIAKFGTADASQAFLQGQIGFYQGMTSDDVSKINFDYKFIGYPNNRVVSASDFLCVSKQSQNKEAAYEVAKFLSFGAAGIEARYKIVAADSNLKLTGLPVNTNATVTAKWFDYVAMKGVKEIYDSVCAGETKVLVEGLKTIPGFKAARFTAKTGITIPGVRGDAELTIGDLIWDVCEGSITVGAYQANMTKERSDALNAQVAAAMEEIKAVQAKDNPAA